MPEDLVAEYREPREWFIALNECGNAIYANIEPLRDNNTWVRVREVLE